MSKTGQPILVIENLCDSQLRGCLLKQMDFMDSGKYDSTLTKYKQHVMFANKQLSLIISFEILVTAVI